MRRKDREITSHSEIIGILQKCKVCRIAMIDNNAPYIVPMNYGYVLDNYIITLFFHCANEGRKIDILKINPYVCFEIDCEGQLGDIKDPCRSGYYYESIIGYGNVETITDIHEKCKSLTNIVKHQTGQIFDFTSEQANTVTVLKLTSKNFCGKKKIKPE